jgi:hypothetical protein
MRARILVFAALVAIALALNLARLSLSIAQTGEDTLRARLATATGAFKAQMELLDARLSPRAVAEVPELIEATRPPADPTQPLGSPDERALRAAASVLQPEPDLLAVVNPQGAIVSRRSKAVAALDDPGKLPLGQAATGANAGPLFASFDGALYRLAAARVPGNAAAAITGTLIDDRFALQLKSQLDADVTLLQAGKVIASSLPLGEDRARILRWAAAPAPGFGVLRVNLPLVGPALSGRLPRGASRYAVRAALVPADSGVQAAVTVPSSPYFGWLARYQAFYVAGLGLFVLFSLLWALLAGAPEPVVQSVSQPVREIPAPAPEPEPLPEPTVSAPRVVRRGSQSLVGTDVGEPRSDSLPRGDVPWTPPSEETPSAKESLDPEVPPPAPAARSPARAAASGVKMEKPAAATGEHPTWSSDPFTPTAGQFSAQEAVEPEVLSAEEAGLVEAPAEGNGSGAAAGAGEFSFSALLEDARGDKAKSGPAKGQQRPFPGDEPTRVEPVSAALLDKMRERDEEQAPKQQGWGALVPEGERTQESMPAVMVSGPAEANVTMQDFSLPAPGIEEQDPDEAHWRETFDKFKELKTRLGEPADKISFQKFAAKLKKNRADLLAKHRCKGVRFSVYEKEGKAAIKASAIR